MKYVFICLSAFIISICVGISFFALTHTQQITKITIQPTPTPISLDSFKIYNLVNDYRAKNGLQRLVLNPTICDFANIRLKQIHTDWSHNGFYPNDKQFYVSVYAGENLIKGFYTEQAVLDNWILSPEHLANIEKPEYTQTCITTDTVGTETYAVQEFASDF